MYLFNVNHSSHAIVIYHSFWRSGMLKNLKPSKSLIINLKSDTCIHSLSELFECSKTEIFPTILKRIKSKKKIQNCPLLLRLRTCNYLKFTAVKERLYLHNHIPSHLNICYKQIIPVCMHIRKRCFINFHSMFPTHYD